MFAKLKVIRDTMLLQKEFWNREVLDPRRFRQPRTWTFAFLQV